MTKPDTTAYKDFGEVSDRLDGIVEQVRDKDTSLERSLDLFDEAIALGSRAVDLVDKVEFTDEEKARLADVPVSDADVPADVADVADADVPSPEDADRVEAAQGSQE